MSASARRYTDPVRSLGHYAQRCLVACPRCGRCAVTGWPERPLAARVTCTHCGFHQATDRVPNVDVWNGPALAYAAHRRCPQCGGTWREPVRSARPGEPHPDAATLTCPVGEHEVTVELDWKPARGAEPLDPIFGLPLWLQEPCCGETLWAFNAEHVAELRAYVAADLRERAHHRSMVARLPRWIVLAKHRDAVLRALARLAERVSACS